MQYDLEERTGLFGERVIVFCKTIIPNEISKPLINQIIRSSTSVGANYMEANSASSKKDFLNKICIVKKELQETKHWLRMITIYDPNKINEIKILDQEVQELILIFGRIISTTRSKR